MIGPHHYGLLGVLTPRQIEVAVAVGVLGLSSKLVGVRLGISMRTVEQHRAEVLARLGCENTVMLARRLALAEDGKDRSEKRTRYVGRKGVRFTP